MKTSLKHKKKGRHLDENAPLHQNLSPRQGRRPRPLSSGCPIETRQSIAQPIRFPGSWTFPHPGQASALLIRPPSSEMARPEQLVVEEDKGRFGRRERNIYRLLTKVIVGSVLFGWRGDERIVFLDQNRLWSFFTNPKLFWGGPFRRSSVPGGRISVRKRRGGWTWS